MRILLFSLICLFLLPGTASAQWYQVEMIVFENLNPDSDGELWYKTPDLVRLDNTVVLKPLHKALMELSGDQRSRNNTRPLLMPYTILPDDKYRLNGIYRVLRLSREYRPLYHISWQQPGVDGNRARAVHLQAEDSGNLYELTIPVRLVTDPMPSDFYEPVELSLDGTLRIRSNLYLYVDLDMVLFRQPPSQQSGLEDTVNETANVEMIPEMKPVEYVRLVETRRIKLNELHYFDHPLFGVIVQVSRYDPE